MIIPQNTVKRRPAVKTGKVSAEPVGVATEATEAQEQPTATLATTEPVIVPAAVPAAVPAVAPAPKATRKTR